MLPELELKNTYSNCSREAMQRVLGSGEAALCSVVYEALLGRIFGGDFEALLAWSRLHPDYATNDRVNDETVERAIGAAWR
jgi:hypothetical protein